VHAGAPAIRAGVVVEPRSTPIACDVSGVPRRLVSSKALTRLSSCSFVNRPVAYSSTALCTSGPRCGCRYAGSNKKRFPSKAILGKEQFLEPLSLIE
jgi:hypothetical protein